MLEKTIFLPSEAATVRIAQKIAHLTHQGDLIYLSGPLGSGKTTFARAFIQALAGDTIEVPSPTFTLVQIYEELSPPVWHFDLYRLKDPTEIEELGLEEALAFGVALIEWPERLQSSFYGPALKIILNSDGSSHGRPVRLLFPKGWQERLQRIGI